jgi:hypothetical protein
MLRPFSRADFVSVPIANFVTAGGSQAHRVPRVVLLDLIGRIVRLRNNHVHKPFMGSGPIWQDQQSWAKIDPFSCARRRRDEIQNTSDHEGDREELSARPLTWINASKAAAVANNSHAVGESPFNHTREGREATAVGNAEVSRSPNLTRTIIIAGSGAWRPSYCSQDSPLLLNPLRHCRRTRKKKTRIAGIVM